MQSLKKEFLIVSMKTKSGGGSKGISIVLAMVVTAILLAVALGIGLILIGQIRMTSAMGYSVLSFFAADTGAERVLYEDKICRLTDCGAALPPGMDWTCVNLLTPPDCGNVRQGGTILDSVGEADYEVIFDDGAISVSSKGIYRENQRAVQINRQP